MSWIAESSGIAGHEILRWVRQSRSALQIDSPLKRLPARNRPTWWLGLSWITDLDDDPAVLVLVRRTDRFTFTEVARVQALLRLHETAHQTLRTH